MRQKHNNLWQVHGLDSWRSRLSPETLTKDLFQPQLARSWWSTYANPKHPLFNRLKDVWSTSGEWIIRVALWLALVVGLYFMLAEFADFSFFRSLALGLYLAYALVFAAGSINKFSLRKKLGFDPLVVELYYHQRVQDFAISYNKKLSAVLAGEGSEAEFRAAAEELALAYHVLQSRFDMDGAGTVTWYELPASAQEFEQRHFAVTGPNAYIVDEMFRDLLPRTKNPAELLIPDAATNNAYLSLNNSYRWSYRNWKSHFSVLAVLAFVVFLLALFFMGEVSKAVSGTLTFTLLFFYFQHLFLRSIYGFTRRHALDTKDGRFVTVYDFERVQQDIRRGKLEMSPEQFKQFFALVETPPKDNSEKTQQK